MKRVYLLPVILLWGCMPWVMVGGKYTESSQGFEVSLPEGWRKHNLTTDVLLITKDGISLQRIGIGRIGLDKELHTKKKLVPGMLPQEVAEVMVDSIRSNPQLTSQQIAENVPATVGGHPGFKLIYTYRTKEGLTKKVAYYGVLVGTWFYYLSYEAPSRYYFARDYPVFERAKETFKIHTATS